MLRSTFQLDLSPAPSDPWGTLPTPLQVGLNAMPGRAELITRLGAGLESESQTTREAIVYADLGELVAVQRRVIDLLAAPLVALDIDRSALN